MTLTRQEFDKLCEAEKYFKTLFDSYRRYYTVKQRDDGTWYVFHRNTSLEYHSCISNSNEEYGNYQTRDAAQFAKVDIIKSRIGMPKEANIGDPLSFISILDDNVNYYELNNQ